jgi:hypothetical protein
VPCGCCIKSAAGSGSAATGGGGDARSGTNQLPTITNVSIVCSSSSENHQLSEKAKQIAGDSYSLDVLPGSITIHATAAAGAAYGIASLGQLVRRDSQIGGAGTNSTSVLDRVPVHITDTPLYPWRGLMIDVSRHFVPMSQILSTIDAMYVLHCTANLRQPNRCMGTINIAQRQLIVLLGGGLVILLGVCPFVWCCLVGGNERPVSTSSAQLGLYNGHAPACFQFRLTNGTRVFGGR